MYILAASTAGVTCELVTVNVVGYCISGSIDCDELFNLLIWWG